MDLYLFRVRAVDTGLSLDSCCRAFVFGVGEGQRWARVALAGRGVVCAAGRAVLRFACSSDRLSYRC